MPDFDRHVPFWLGAALVLSCLFASACCDLELTGPPSTRSSSADLETLAQKVAFLESYVTFRRSYEALDFDIFYANNSGGLLPGPSDWDLRLRAVVPADEMGDWTRGMEKVEAPVTLAVPATSRSSPSARLWVGSTVKREKVSSPVPSSKFSPRSASTYP